MERADTIKVCRQICTLADLLRDIWLHRQSREKLQEFMSLTISQQRMLRTVWRMTELFPQGIMLKELAEKLSLSSSAVSVMVDVMVRRGFFERTVDEHDRRKVFIRISADGMIQAQAIENGFADICEKFLSGVSEADVAQATGFLSDFQQYLITLEQEEER